MCEPEPARSNYAIHIHNPRPEYTTNLYHAMEEVYSLLQTTMLINVSLPNVVIDLHGQGEILMPHMKLRTAPVHRSGAQLGAGWARWRAPLMGGGVPTGAAFPRAGHIFLGGSSQGSGSYQVPG